LNLVFNTFFTVQKIIKQKGKTMNDFENEETRLPEWIIQKYEERQKNLFESKIKEELKEEREREKNKYRVELPKDDTFVEMGIYAKNLTMPKKVRKHLNNEYKAQHKIAPDAIRLDLIKDKIPEVNINGTNYIIREVINETDGFQAIVFENPNTHECTFTIAGSYSLAQPHLNPAEWYKDWWQNNIAIGFKHLPPQLETAIKNLDRCKEKYNITSVTGYSLGAILAGLLVQFKRNKHLKTYLYNGGLPKKLVNALQEKYGDEISLDEPLNMVTMLSNGELVTDLLSIVRGAGIFLLNGGKKGHDLEYHENATKKDYKEIDQSGIAIIDGLKDELSNSAIGTGGMYRLSIPLDFSKTVKKEKEEQTENNSTNSPAEQNGNKPLEGRVEENVYKDSTESKSDGIPTGYAADLTTDNTERELLKQLRENSRADIGIADKIRNEDKILEKLINNQAQNNSQSILQYC